MVTHIYNFGSPYERKALEVLSFEIPKGGFLLVLGGNGSGIADTYSALRVDRPYRKAKTHPETLEIIKNEEGTHFDPEIVEAFMKVESEIEALFERMLEQY